MQYTGYRSTLGLRYRVLWEKEKKLDSVNYGNAGMTAKAKGTSGFTLKMIAVITMLIDHTAAIIIQRAILAPAGTGFVTPDNAETWFMIYQIMRTIGRMAFPIYCFLLVEGFVHTRNVKKYALRLLVFALISEIPFDLAFNRRLWDYRYNNVFLTLFLGLVTIACIRFVNSRIRLKGDSKAKNYLCMLVRFIVVMAIAFAGMALAEVPFCTDYGAGGVAVIVAMYLLRQYPKTSFAAGVVLLTVMCGSIEIAALLMLVPIAFYNGNRGRQIKYFFYAFYPVHLLVLVGISQLMGLGI